MELCSPQRLLSSYFNPPPHLEEKAGGLAGNRTWGLTRDPRAVLLAAAECEQWSAGVGVMIRRPIDPKRLSRRHLTCNNFPRQKQTPLTLEEVTGRSGARLQDWTCNDYYPSVFIRGI